MSGSYIIQLRRSSSSLLGPRSIIPLSVLSRNAEDTYHNALLLSKTTAAIHVFYDRPIWNTNPLPNLKDCSGRLRVSTRRPIYPRGRFREFVVLSLDGIEVSTSNIAPRVLTELRPSSFPSLEALVTDACAYRPTLSVMLPVPASSSLKTLIALSLDHHNGSDARYIVSHLHPLRGLSNLNDLVDTPLS